MVLLQQSPASVLNLPYWETETESIRKESHDDPVMIPVMPVEEAPIQALPIMPSRSLCCFSKEQDTRKRQPQVILLASLQLQPVVTLQQQMSMKRLGRSIVRRKRQATVLQHRLDTNTNTAVRKIQSWWRMVLVVKTKTKTNFQRLLLTSTTTTTVDLIPLKKTTRQSILSKKEQEESKLWGIGSSMNHSSRSNISIHNIIDTPANENATATATANAATMIQAWWRGNVAKHNYHKILLTWSLLPKKTRSNMVLKIRGPRLIGFNGRFLCLQ